MIHPFQIYREEAGGDAGGSDAGGGGGGIAATMDGGGDAGGDAGAAGGDDSAFSFYTGDVTDEGGRQIREEIAGSFKGEEGKQMMNLLMKYRNNEDPMKDFSKGVSNLNFLSKRKDIDMLMELPEDAPAELVAERKDARKKLNGTPETAEAYGLKKPEGLAENIYWPEGMEQKHMELAHKHDISPEFLKEQFAMHADMLAGAGQHEETLYAGQLNEQKKALEAEFGHDLQSVIDQADRGGLSSGEFTDEQMATATKALTKVGLGTNFIKHMKWTADSISEDKRISAPSQGHAGGLSDFDKARDILGNEANPLNKAYWDSNHPRHDEAVNAASNFNKAGHERMAK